MKLKYTVALLLVVLLSSCYRKHKNDNLNYYQDFECIKGWYGGVPALTSEVKAHSGTYSLLTNSKFDYSFGFTSSIAEISSKPLKKIKASVWCLSPDKLCNGSFCVQIINSSNENKLWVARPFVDFIKSENSWTKATIEADIPKDALNPSNVVKVFLWNNGTVPVYGDDIEVQFTE